VTNEVAVRHEGTALERSRQPSPLRRIWQPVGHVLSLRWMRGSRMAALGKLFNTTAFKLTLAYLTVFALFAAFLLGYFACGRCGSGRRSPISTPPAGRC
jgi:hypothetical protein